MHLLSFELFESSDPQEIYDKNYHDLVSWDEFLKDAALDPTSVFFENGEIKKLGKYIKWIMEVRQREPRWAEDREKLVQYLKVYNQARLSHRIDDTGIFKYKTIADLYKVVAPFLQDSEALSKRAQHREEEERILAEETELFYEDDVISVRIPLTYQASCQLGADTSWCTALRNTSAYYNSYSRYGNLYIIQMKKNPSERYQVHWERGQWMDTSDVQINVGDMLLEVPSLLNAFYQKEQTGSAWTVYKVAEGIMDNGPLVFISNDGQRVIINKDFDDSTTEYVDKDEISANIEDVFYEDPQLLSKIESGEWSDVFVTMGNLKKRYPHLQIMHADDYIIIHDPHVQFQGKDLICELVYFHEQSKDKISVVHLMDAPFNILHKEKNGASIYIDETYYTDLADEGIGYFDQTGLLEDESMVQIRVFLDVVCSKYEVAKAIMSTEYVKKRMNGITGLSYDAAMDNITAEVDPANVKDLFVGDRSLDTKTLRDIAAEALSGRLEFNSYEYDRRMMADLFDDYLYDSTKLIIKDVIQKDENFDGDYDLDDPDELRDLALGDNYDFFAHLNGSYNEVLEDEYQSAAFESVAKEISDWFTGEWDAKNVKFDGQSLIIEDVLPKVVIHGLFTHTAGKDLVFWMQVSETDESDYPMGITWDYNRFSEHFYMDMNKKQAYYFNERFLERCFNDELIDREAFDKWHAENKYPE